MDAEANKAIVRRYLDMWNTGNTDLADAVLAPSYVDHTHPEITSIEGVKQSVLKTRAAFPDFHIRIMSMISEGDNVTLSAVIERTQQGEKVISRVVWSARIEDGKMAEWWLVNERSG